MKRSMTCRRLSAYEQLMQNNEHDIRFVDSSYRELFRIPDGGSIRVEYSKEPDRGYTAECKYVDDYHTSINGFTFHIRQFAEMLEQNGCTCRPETAQLEQTAPKPTKEKAQDVSLS